MPATNGHHLAELGFDVIYEDIDFFEQDLGECAVTNPLFSELPGVLARLRELGKPFVVIMPCSTLTTRYFRDLFPDIQVIVPRRRIQFRKLVDGVEVKLRKNGYFGTALNSQTERDDSLQVVCHTTPSSCPSSRSCIPTAS